MRRRGEAPVFGPTPVGRDKPGPTKAGERAGVGAARALWGRLHAGQRSMARPPSAGINPAPQKPESARESGLHETLWGRLHAGQRSMAPPPSAGINPAPHKSRRESAGVGAARNPVGPASCRPAECGSAPVGPDKPGPTKAGESVRELGAARALWGRLHAGRRSVARPPSAGINPAPHKSRRARAGVGAARTPVGPASCRPAEYGSAPVGRDKPGPTKAGARAAVRAPQRPPLRA